MGLIGVDLTRDLLQRHSGDQHGEHHPQLVLQQWSLHAGVQLPAPHGSMGGVAILLLNHA
jgi:hypothetical protein